MDNTTTIDVVASGLDTVISLGMRQSLRLIA